MRQLTIDGITIDDESDCFVIAEIGHNHQGDVDKAKEMFDAAAACGANAVKLQKRDNKTLYTREFYDRVYNSENSFAETYGLHREFLEFGVDEYEELQKYAADRDLVFFATAFDVPSADFLGKLDVPAIKIASGDVTNTPLLRYVSAMNKPIVLSTGGADMADVERAYEAATTCHDQVAVLQCTAGYPPAWEELDLRVISTYRERFPDAVIGWSSHDSGIAMAVGAYVLGARILEKHFTLNRAMKGTDHSFSLEVPGLQRMVRDLRRVRVSMGSGIKKQWPSEAAPIEKMSKKLVAARDLPAGHVLEDGDLAGKSPGDGIKPWRIDEFMGRPLRVALHADEAITEDAVHPRN